MLTQDKLKELLEYNPETGIFTHKVQRNKRKPVGSTAGFPVCRGYIRLGLLGKYYIAHKLAILYMEGYLPESVDHIDNNTSNNIYTNLRVCSQKLNCYNTRISSSNTTGVKGVTFCKGKGNSLGAYKAQIRSDIGATRKNFTVSIYGSKEKALEAATIWIRATRELLHGEYANHG